jgi:hypothetical protein
VVSPARHRDAEAQETLVSLSPRENSSPQLWPALVDVKMFPAVSTATQVELPVQVTAVRPFDPSMSCLVAVAVVPDIARAMALPVPSTATQDVVEVHATPLSPLELSI